MGGWPASLPRRVHGPFSPVKLASRVNPQLCAQPPTTLNAFLSSLFTSAYRLSLSLPLLPANRLSRPFELFHLLRSERQAAPFAQQSTRSHHWPRLFQLVIPPGYIYGAHSNHTLFLLSITLKLRLPLQQAESSRP